MIVIYRVFLLIIKVTHTHSTNGRPDTDTYFWVTLLLYEYVNVKVL